MCINMNNRRNRDCYTSFDVRLSGLAYACTFSADYIFFSFTLLFCFCLKRILDRNLKICFFSGAHAHSLIDVFDEGQILGMVEVE